MERDNGITSDEKLMAFWVQQREDSLRALRNANRQIAYLSNFVIRDALEEPDETDWIIRGND